MKKGEHKKSVTLKKKLVFPMLCITLLQCGIFLFAIFSSNIVDKLKVSAYDNIQTTTQLRGNTVNSYLARIASNDQSYDRLQESCLKLANQADKQIDNTTVKQLMYVIQNNNASGAFIIMQEGENNKTLYLRTNSTAALQGELKPSDVLMRYGDSAIAAKNGITSFDENWTSNITLDKTDNKYDFYYAVKEATRLNPYLEYYELGYWSNTIKLSGDDNSIITYTMPILDERHNFLGVIGVEISVERFQNILPYQELSAERRSAYAVGTLDNDIISCMVEYGPLYKNMLGKDYTIKLTQKYVYDGIVQQPDSKMASPALITTYPLNIYSANSPYTQQWVLASIVEKSNALQNVSSLGIVLLIAFLVSIAVCGAGILWAGYSFNRPVEELVEYMRAYNPDKEKLVLPKIYINELDQLTDIILSLNDSITHAASRLSQILELSNVPLGAIEYDPTTDIVFCTENVPKILCFEESDKQTYRYFSKDFKEKIDPFLLHTRPYRASDNETEKPGCVTLQYTDDHGLSSWINFHNMQRGGKKICVVQDVSETIKEKIKLEYERDYDALTNLLNRRSFKKHVKEILANSNRLGIGAMIMWDMDNLKYINDTYGHDAGDRYLAEAARLFGTLSSYRGIVARMSGDEFFAFLYGFRTKQELRSTIERMHNRLRQTTFMPPDGQPMAIRASGGIAWYPDNGSEYDELTKHADFAMYHVKNTRRGELAEFDEKAFQRDAVLFNGREALNRFIENKLVKFAFQPIVDINTGEVFAYEALMRPQCAELPSVFEVMRLARAQSRLYQIEVLTMFGVMHAAQEQKEKLGNAKIFINSIPNTVITDEDVLRFEKNFADILPNIVIEIIESEQSDAVCMEQKRKFCEKWNAKIAIDDFGAGYSTESSLLHIAPDFVKIDMSIIRNIDKDTNRQKLVSNITSYTKSRSMKIIAEGVESFEELKFLKSIGVDYIQGYFFAQPQFVPPIPDKQSIKMLKDYNNQNKQQP